MIIAKQKNAYGFSRDQGEKRVLCSLPITTRVRMYGVWICIFLPLLAANIFFFLFKGTYGSRRAWHRRRNACGVSRERYP